MRFQHRFLVLQTLILVSTLTIAATNIFGQTTQLRGRVLDENEFVVPGAEVNLTNQSTQMSRRQISDELGRYQFLNLPPGFYTIFVELSGFKIQTVQDIRLEVNFPKTLDIPLTIGELSESVTVVGNQSSLNKVDGTQGNNMTPEQILGIPLLGRNLVETLTLQPGVTMNGEVTGSRSDQIILTLDGINVNDQFRGTDRGVPFMPILRVTPDSVQEFRMVTSNPTSRQGRSSGAQVSFITRSGTNNIHGALYEYHRNKATAANYFFNNRMEGDPDGDGRPGMVSPDLIRNVFGGSIGAPIVKDKAFFFFNYEGSRDRSQSLAMRTVPLTHMGEGRMKFKDDEGSTVEWGSEEILANFPETEGINPTAVQVFKEAARKYPAYKDTINGDGLNTGDYYYNADAPFNWNTFTSKLDFNLTDSQSLFIRGNYQWDHDNSEPYWPDSPANRQWSHPTGLSTGHIWTIQPNLVNDFRYGFTRQAYSDSGDTTTDSIKFARIYQHTWGTRPSSRIAALNNFNNNTSWILSNHTLQFGTDIRLIQSKNSKYSNSFDASDINSWQIYEISGEKEKGTALAALLGRYTKYTLNSNYEADGNLLPYGSPNKRVLSTQEFEFYFEDSWRVTPNFSVNLGLRWGVNTPISETSGYQVQPTVSLNEFFNKRISGALQGVPFNELIVVDRSGPFYDKSGYYPTDWNNLAPRISFAYSPHFENRILKTILGDNDQSVIRGGFAVMYDRVGSMLALQFDDTNTLGFTWPDSTEQFTFNLTDNLGPLFTGFDQKVRSFSDPEFEPAEKISFPLPKPADRERRIETSLDDAIISPVNYNWNISFGRELPGDMFLEVAYIGRSARDLLATRDVNHPNNIVDPKSGVDWYTAASFLYDHRIKDTPVEQVPNNPFFENLFPNLSSEWIWAKAAVFWGVGNPNWTSTQQAYNFISRPDQDRETGLDILDWTYLQAALDGATPWGDNIGGVGIYPDIFYHPQYAALATWSTVANSNYHAMTISLRKRFQANLTFDVNYTWSKSMDNASGRQDIGLYRKAGFIINPLRPDDHHSVSDFDIQHIINSNWLWSLPVGRGKHWLSDLPGVAEAMLGGWSLNGIFRWNSGPPKSSPTEWRRWATNWNVPSYAVRRRDPKAKPHKSGDHPNYWADQQYAYNSFRDAKAGETGDRNVFRLTGFVTLDLGLHKSFRMPYAENHRFTFAWEVFNVTNTQKLGPPQCPLLVHDWLTYPDPQIGDPPAEFGNIYSTQGIPRIMQFSLRYDF